MAIATTTAPTVAVGETLMCCAMRCGRATAPTTPRAAPRRPPARPSTEASTRNWRRMTCGVAPSALRRPISRTRSVMDTNMKFITPMPPTSSERAATPASRTVRVLSTEVAVARIDCWLALHNIATPAGADFTIASQQSILATATSVDKTLPVLLAGVAAISLLVGGIGVMNIMLVSITERVREIGLRKALGATPQVIRRQFLVEASVLGLAGGLLGAALGVVGAVALPHLIAQHISVSPTATVGAVVVAIAIGVVFGVYPASRAARLAG